MLDREEGAAAVNSGSRFDTESSSATRPSSASSRTAADVNIFVTDARRKGVAVVTGVLDSTSASP